MIRSDLPLARGPSRSAGGPSKAQLGPAHDHEGTGLGAPVMEPSAATKSEIDRRRTSVLRFWLAVAGASGVFVPVLAFQSMPDADRLVLMALAGAFAAFAAALGYLQYCRVNLLTIYERGIAPPVKPHYTLRRGMDFHVPFSEFARIEVEDNDIDRKELAEQIDFRFVFHYPDGKRLVLAPSILGRDASREQMVALFSSLKEALGKEAADRVELRKVFPDGRRPIAAVSSRSLRVRVGAEVREFPWSRVKKLRIRPAKLGTGASFDRFDVLLDGEWLALEARRIPELKKADLITFVEEVLRIARALKIEILQE